MVFHRTFSTFKQGLWRKRLLAAGRDGCAEQRLLVLEAPIDAELGYLRPLGDLVQRRRLKTQFHKKLARGVEYRLGKRLVGGSAAPALNGFSHNISTLQYLKLRSTIPFSILKLQSNG
ncbi:hypothetical protein EMIT093MI4_230002 [Pseudomonas sp. IT-93MI4]